MIFLMEKTISQKLRIIITCHNSRFIVNKDDMISSTLDLALELFFFANVIVENSSFSSSVWKR